MIFSGIDILRCSEPLVPFIVIAYEPSFAMPFRAKQGIVEALSAPNCEKLKESALGYL